MRAARALFAVAVAVSWTALAEIPLGDGTPAGGLDGGTPILDANTCAACHDRSGTIESTLYMPYDGWVSSMMGNSARDPLFLAALTVANQDRAGSGQFCLRCHSPGAFVRGHTLPPDGSGFDEIDQQGVQCEVCHRSTGAPDGGPALIGNAQIFFEPGNIKHGPYENIESPAHLGRRDPFTSSSELCGQCHQVENPLASWKDGAGADTGQPFPLDTTYEEWKGSAFARAGGKGCAECHMPELTGQHSVAKFGPFRSNPRKHTLAGGNAWGVRAVLAANPQLADSLDDFEQTRQAALEQLKGAAEVELTVPEGTQPAGGKVKVRVKVRNLTGHKLPTGYADGRRIFVQVLVNDQAVSGQYDVTEATLREDPQLRVYEAKHGVAGQGAEDHLVLHDTIVKDTRIPPAGFEPTPRTRPVGTAWFDDGAGGFRDYDEAEYEVPLPKMGQTAELAVRLMYQPTTREYVEFLGQENRTDDRGRTLQEVFAATERAAPVEMARADATIPLSGCGCGAMAGGEWAVACLLAVGVLGRRLRK